MVWGEQGRGVSLELEGGEALSLTFGELAPPEPERLAIHRYEDGVFYVDLNTASWPEIQAQLEEDN